ncbi:MAG: hypothetical protein OEM01_05510 [Desulfobulbaceae bacterium]|nr:hypothetical protein [Desulfobulbaceae bacterium]
MRKRSTPATFNLSFLDIMFCGFGAVVLLVLVINANTISSRKQHHKDLRADVVRLELETRTGQEYLVQLKNSLDIEDQKVRAASGRSNEVLARINSMQEELADLQLQTVASKEHTQALRADLESLDQQNRQLGGELEAKQEQGTKVRRFEGEGNRQYLTGLKLGGRRVLLLIDSSASMLDRTIVNIIRRRNMDDETKGQSPKWQRAIKTAEWLIANLPPESLLQMFDFNTGFSSLSSENQGRWVQATDSLAVSDMIKNLHSRIPGGGTSLENAFTLARNLQPRPDNILLITDGLPTQGAKISKNNTVSGKQRMKYFERAVEALPRDIPVNTILFPMEGDPMAAVLFWKLAVDSGGSFLTPTRDWP